MGCEAARVIGGGGGRDTECNGPLTEEFWEDIGLCCCTVDGKGSWQGRLQGNRRPAVRPQGRGGERREAQPHGHYGWFLLPGVVTDARSKLG